MISGNTAFSSCNVLILPSPLPHQNAQFYNKKCNIRCLNSLFFGKKIKLVQTNDLWVSTFVEKTPKKKHKNWVAVFGPGGGFFGVGTSELIVIGAVAWLVLGPKKLYQLARDIGKISGEIKNVAEEARQTFQQAVDLENVKIEGQPPKNIMKSSRKSKNKDVVEPKKNFMKELDQLVKTEIKGDQNKKIE